MAFKICAECKSEVPDSSQQCQECGFTFESLTPRKCPECETLVDFSSEMCPSCGFPYESLNDLMIDAAVLDSVPASGAEELEPAGPVPEAPSDGYAETVPQAPTSDPSSGATLEPAGPVPEAPLDGYPETVPQTQPSDTSSGAPVQAEQVASPVSTLREACKNLADNDYIITVLVNYISAVKTDLVNNPIKAFIEILAGLDKSNKDLNETVLQQGINALAGVQEATATTVSEITSLIASQSQEAFSKSQELALTTISEITLMVKNENREALSKSQELALTVVSEITALKEANSAALAELSNSIKQVSAQNATAQPETIAEPSSFSEYILYLCLAMLLFVTLNFFITIYVVKLIK